MSKAKVAAVALTTLKSEERFDIRFRVADAKKAIDELKRFVAEL